MRDSSTDQRTPSQQRKSSQRKSSRDSIGATLMWFAIPAVIIGISMAYVFIFEQSRPLAGYRLRRLAINSRVSPDCSSRQFDCKFQHPL
jgi:hypothetical protein